MIHRQHANVVPSRTRLRCCKTASALVSWSGAAPLLRPIQRQQQITQDGQQPSCPHMQASEAATGLAARSWRCSRTRVCSLASDSPRPSSSLTAASIWDMLVALYKFSRPHTMLGTFISILSMSALALQSSPAWSMQTALVGVGQALSAALLMNIAIVGINQLHDVEIDKINKPYLPLASGEWSMETGNAVVVGSTLFSLAIGWASGSLPLLATLVLSLTLGILYSVELPFMRWKRSPVLAASCILAVRALAVQLGFYFHMQAAIVRSHLGSLSGGMTWLGVPAMSHLQLTPAISFTVAFMLLFSVVIALFKDIPDTMGDSRAGIRTLTVRLGVPRVFWTCIWILTAAYAGAVVYSVLAAHLSATAASASTLPFLGSLSGLFQATPSTSASAAAAQAAATAAGHGLGNAMPASLSLLVSTTGGTLGLRTLTCVAGHCVMAGLLWQRALRTDLTSNKDIAACYMHVWKLFYAEYILIPLLL